MLHDGVQRRQAVLDGFPLYASVPRGTSTQRVVEQFPGHRHLDGVLVETVQHFEKHFRLRRFELQLCRFGEEARFVGVKEAVCGAMKDISELQSYSFMSCQPSKYIFRLSENLRIPS